MTKHPILLFRTRLLAGGLVALLLGLPALSAQDIARASRTGEANEAKVEKANIVAERFNFTPSVVRVPKGVRLEITLTSDDTFHGFRIPRAGVNKIIPARGRGSIKVSFEARERGTYTFECSRPCGAGHTMMRGVIIVD